MRYTVIWMPSAEQDLAALWLDATHRDEITRAAHALDQQLRTDAERRGESRSEGRRVLFAPPLGVTFRVNTGDAIVRVLHVWSFRQGGQQ